MMKMKHVLAPALTALALGMMLPAHMPAQAGEKAKKAEQKPAAQKAQVAESEALKKAKKGAKQAAREKGAAQVEAKRAQVLQEAVEALKQTRLAIAALEKKDKKAALDALAKVVGQLEILLARDPKLALAPVDVVTYALDVHADVESVKKAVKTAVDLLEKGRVQDARAIVSGLASEIVIEVANIPLSTYPDAIKAVVPLVEAGKFEEAKAALIAALNTLVITRHIIPLPVLRAEHLLLLAEQLAEKKDRSKDEQKQLEALLQAARKELKFAEALGYGDEGAFKPFYDMIDEIEKKVAGGKHGKGFFDDIKKALEQFRLKLF